MDHPGIWTPPRGPKVKKPLLCVLWHSMSASHSEQRTMELFATPEALRIPRKNLAYHRANAERNIKQWAGCHHGLSTRSARSRLDSPFLCLFLPFPMPPPFYSHPHPTTRRPPSHTSRRPPSPHSHPLRSLPSIVVMNRLSDYDDQIIRATPYETLFDYRATVGYFITSPSPA